MLGSFGGNDRKMRRARSRRSGRKPTPRPRPAAAPGCVWP